MDVVSGLSKEAQDKVSFALSINRYNRQKSVVHPPLTNNQDVLLGHEVRAFELDSLFVELLS